MKTNRIYIKLNKNIFKHLLLLIAALILEIIPYSAVCVYGNLTDTGLVERVTNYYSSFSLVPLGNANFAPFVTGILTCLLIVITGAGVLMQKKKIIDFSRIITGITAIISALPLFILMYSWASLLITTLLCAQYIILTKYSKNL